MPLKMIRIFFQLNFKTRFLIIGIFIIYYTDIQTNFDSMKAGT